MVMDEMYHAAKAMLKNSYAPYSKFLVGASVLTDDGKIFAGCNVENASYSLTKCAESTAISTMVASGYRKIKAVCVIGGTGDILCTPCGACRQIIREFASLDTPIYMADLNGIQRKMTLSELLPDSFGPDHLEK